MIGSGGNQRCCDAGGVRSLRGVVRPQVRSSIQGVRSFQSESFPFWPWGTLMPPALTLDKAVEKKSGDLLILTPTRPSLQANIPPFKV